MKKISNPFSSQEGYHCFGCCHDNPIGLKLTFYDDGDEIVSVWHPREEFQGYHNLLHGGIQAALMDEIASWVVYTKIQTTGFTSNMQVRYRKNINVNNGPITLRAKCIQMRRNLADIEVNLFDADNVLCANALVTYFTYDSKKAREQLFYPGPEAFFKEE